MRPKIFVSGDIDGFFGLMIDNLIQLLVIIALCVWLCGFPIAFITSVVMPGIAVSLLIGNLFYAWLSYRLGIREGRDDVTALPYGINTVSLFAFIFFILFPVYKETGDYVAAWKAGILASFLSGLIEVGGSFVAGWIRRSTPRAALLSSLAGIAITFISMDFLLRTFQNPLVGFIPFGIILVQYFANVKFPLMIPGGLLAVIVGTGLAWLSGIWGTPLMQMEQVSLATATIGFEFPKIYISELFSVLEPSYLSAYFAVILPMGIFNVIGSLQNLESADAAGDSYDTKSSLLVNGIGTIAGSLFGSPFPTTIYIGHPGWKGLGAKIGYSVLNGAFITVLSLFGLIGLISALIPIEAGMAIVLWIGIVIGAQAFQSVPKNHAPAVVVGLFPALAGWAVLMVQSVFIYADNQLQTILSQSGVSGVHNLWMSNVSMSQPILPYALDGVLSLSQGFLLTAMVWASITVFIIDRQFKKASIWCLAGGVLSLVGIIHAYTLSGNAILTEFRLYYDSKFTIAYILLAVLMFIASYFKLSPRKE
ncbi:NCS2 family permease [Leptospira sp. GIMC2001]|uniref:NCS2 family permease n=1 Tax=Leptospira sp. GIMC2001 TaxID=1513297 RepID=UPI00234925A0|nr:NCS2 family permease [Leptospira sp. GIMC2001]WCL47594.1 NCS2 family permease [Leptospira sp. GIMC2001]